LPDFSDAPLGGAGEGASALRPTIPFAIHAPPPGIVETDNSTRAATSVVVPPRRLRPLAFDTAGATACQAAAFAALAEFIPCPTRRAFLLAGAAGTGKTHTTVEAVRAALAAGYDCIVLATTNKAARVLRAKAATIACPATREVFARASTVERFLRRKQMVKFRDKASAVEQKAHGLAAEAEVERRGYREVAFEPTEGTVVVVDEVSMLPARDAALFEQRCRKTIFVGDRYQLPPVGFRGWLETRTPDVELREIVRQAASSGIARLGQEIRRAASAAAVVASPLAYGEEVGDDRLQSWLASLGDDGMAAVDMILCHTNRTCGEMNIRAVKARFPDWSEGGPPPVGALVFAHEAFVVGRPPNVRVLIGKACQLEVLAVLGDARNGDYRGWRLKMRNLDEGTVVEAPCLAATFSGLGYQKTAQERGALTHGMAEIGYGYSLTVHKSQGSEWPTVMLVDEYPVWRLSTPDVRRWLYTGVTRARANLLYARVR
jgi:exodeoxyribonuclease-5